MKSFVYDLEVFPNYFLAVFKDVDTGDIVSFDHNDILGLMEFVLDHEKIFIGFNSLEYDDVIIKFIISRLLKNQLPTPQQIKTFSDKIILSNDQFVKELIYYPKLFEGRLYPWGRSVDLMRVSLKLQSLKKHGAALRLKNVQDLPYHPDTKLTKAEKKVVFDYCCNDIETTYQLYLSLKDDLKTRDDLLEIYPFMEEYSHCMKASQLAERFIVHEYDEATGDNIKKLNKPKDYYFDCAKDIQPGIVFKTKKNQEALTKLKAVGRVSLPIVERRGKLICDDKKLKGELSSCEFMFGDTTYKLGVGGLHSHVTPARILSPNKTIVEADVSSYYPHLILNFDQPPQHLSREFLGIFKGIIDLRLKYKAEGNKAAANSLKILINSIYGKLGNAFSSFTDQRLKYMVTINGQLWLLVLAEMLHEAGFPLYMGNTDGIFYDMLDVANEEESSAIIRTWADISKLPIDPVYGYNALIMRNINSYAARINGKWKLKKDFDPNPNQFPEIISKAALDHLVNDTPIHEAVRKSDDILDYVYCAGVSRETEKYVIEKVTWGDDQVQQVNRFYRAKKGNLIIVHKIDKENGEKATAKLKNSDKSVVVNRIENNDIPDDLDYEYYERQTRILVSSVLNENPLNREFGLSYTYFTSNKDSTVEKGFLSWNEIVSKYLSTSHITLDNKNETPAFNMTVWDSEGEVIRDENGEIKRVKRNAVGLDALIIDIDNHGVKKTDSNYLSVDEAIELYKEFEFILYTSFSHTKMKDKFRMIFPLSRAILKHELELPEKLEPSQHSLLNSLREIFPAADNASFRIAQIFYEPSCKPGAPRVLHHNPGFWFDPDLLLDKETGIKKDSVKASRKGVKGGEGKIFYETFDYLQFCKDHGLYKLQLDTNKHAVACAFSDSHSDVPGTEKGWLNDTETVIFTGEIQTCKCMHSHCEDITSAFKVAKMLEAEFGTDAIRPYCETEEIFERPKVEKEAPVVCKELEEAFELCRVI